MKLLSNKAHAAEIEAAREQGRTEAKGFYSEQVQDFNKYLAIIAQQTRGMIEIQPVGQLQRAELKALYLTNGPLYGVINIIANAVAACSRYIEVTDKGGKVLENHFVTKLLARPNDRFSRSKFFYAAATNRLLYGDEWNYCPKGVGKSREPKEIYVIPSDTVGVKHGSWQELFEGLVINGKAITADAVFENFAYNPDDKSFFGVSKASVAAAYLSIIERAAGREATALKNGGAANLISPAAADIPALPTDVADTEEKINRGSNANKTLMVRMPVNVQPLGSDPANLSLLESHDNAINVLCFVYGVPVDLYLGQAKYENMREAKKALYEQVAIPFLDEWCEDLVSYLGLTGQIQVKVNTDNIDLLQDDPYSVAQNMANIGAFTTNEIREAAGWERIEEGWADEVRLPLGLQLGDQPTDFNEE
jgi:HK97 family phage portal protein